MFAIVPAAGQGLRFGGPVSKQFCLLGGKPLLLHTLNALASVPEIEGLVVVVPAGQEGEVRGSIQTYTVPKVMEVVAGDETRQGSVARGYKSLPGCDYVLVHDGVRPLVTTALIQQTIQAAKAYGAAVCGLPLKETVKRVNREQRVLETVDRQGLWSIQTPQVFRYDWLGRALREAENAGLVGTDEAMLVERLGFEVRVVPGEEENIKVTTVKDLEQVRLYWERRQS